MSHEGDPRYAQHPVFQEQTDRRREMYEVAAGDVLGGWNEHHCIDNQGCRVCAGSRAVDDIFGYITLRETRIAADAWDQAMATARNTINRRAGTYEADIDLLALGNPFRAQEPSDARPGGES